MHYSREFLDAIYAVQGAAPWTLGAPPAELVQLVDRGVLRPGKVLEVGCGEGHAAIFLAQRGFAVTAIDYASRAVDYARDHAREAGATVDFRYQDWEALDPMKESFDSVVDWRFLHGICQEDGREAYVARIASLLRPGGRSISTSFSAKSDYWGTGRIRTTAQVNTTLYFATMEELMALFVPHFTVLEQHEMALLSKDEGPVLSNCLVLEKPLNPPGPRTLARTRGTAGSASTAAP